MDFDVIFYEDTNRKKPVQKFLDEVYGKNLKLWSVCIGGIEKIKHRIYQKEPLSKSLGDGLYEIRVRSKNDIARIIYAFAKGQQIILLHGFVKKTQKTPLKELVIAKQRLKQLQGEEYENKKN